MVITAYNPKNIVSVKLIMKSPSQYWIKKIVRKYWLFGKREVKYKFAFTGKTLTADELLKEDNDIIIDRVSLSALEKTTIEVRFTDKTLKIFTFDDDSKAQTCFDDMIKTYGLVDISEIIDINNNK